MQNNAVIVFDSKHKEVHLLPVGFFRDKESSILERPDEIVPERKKQTDYGDVLFAEGRDYELGLNGEYQDFTFAFKKYYEGAKLDHSDCCLKVAFYFLYGLGCGFKSRALFEIYLHKAVSLGSSAAKLFEYRWNSFPKDKVISVSDICSFPLQAW